MCVSLSQGKSRAHTLHMAYSYALKIRMDTYNARIKSLVHGNFQVMKVKKDRNLEREKHRQRNRENERDKDTESEREREKKEK